MSLRQQVTSGGTSRMHFPATQWTVVLSAGNKDGTEAEKALASLCKAYWYPLYAFARRRGHSPHEAEDLTQEYFARLLDKKTLAGFERQTAKFRSFLLTTFKAFLTNEWHHANAEKRGGRAQVVSMDADVEQRYSHELTAGSTPETLFDQQWAMTVLERVLARVAEEYAAARKKPVFDALCGCLPGSHEEVSYGEAGMALQMSETAVRMAAHRLRRRYGELLRAEIAATVASPEHIESEIRELIEVLGRR